jgi:hypothetical protein
MPVRLVAALLLLLVSSAARAEEDTPEKAQARLLLGQGNALFEKGDLRGALADFRAAYALYPSPKLLVNAAACERELGDLPGAANDLRRYLDEAPDDDPLLAEKARNELKALERKLGRVALSGWPQRSAVEVDGRPARDPFYVRPGEHHVKVRGPGGEELERDVSVQAGENVEVSMPALAAQSAHVPPPSTGKPKSRWWIGVLVGGLVVVGAGVGLGVGLGTRADPGPLRGDLGTFKFSDFK